MSLPEFSLEEVATHNSSDSLWIAIEGKVFDVTSFQADHPGGTEVLLDNAGKDATTVFQDIGHSEDAINMRDTKFLIGTLKASEASAPPPVVTPSPRPAAAPQQQASRQMCSCCGREDCCWIWGGVGAVAVAALAIGIGFLLYKRYHK